MKYKVLVGAILIAPVTFGIRALVQDRETVDLSEVVAAHCPDQWEAYLVHQPDGWSHIPPIPIDPSLDHDFFLAYLQLGASIEALSVHIGSVMALWSSPENARSGFEIARTHYELSACLMPTQEERDFLIQDHHEENPTLSENELREELFTGHDSYNCMRFGEASAQIFQLDPQSENYLTQFQEIMDSTLVVCD